MTLRALLVIGVGVIATALHAQDDLYAPTRPAMRRGPDLAIVTPLSLPDLYDPVRPPMRRDPVLVVATQLPPQPSAPVTRGWRPATPADQPPVTEGPYRTVPPLGAPTMPPASLAQPPPGPVLALNPDVAVTVSPMSRAASERILGKRIGKVAMVWLVTFENRTLDPVLISPSAIYRHVSHLQPFDHVFMSQLIEEGAKNSVLARAGRVADDTGKLLAFAIASKAIQISEVWPGALVAGAVWAIPQFIQRLKGAETPVGANFERLAWVAPITLGPVETATAHIFSEIWDSPSSISFSLDVTMAALRKSLQ